MNGRAIIAALIVIAAAMVVSPAGVAAEEEERPSASAEVAVLTKYVWRGFELSNDSIVVQPSATVSYKGFGFNLWGNLDTDFDGPSGADDSQLNETDWTLSYDTAVGPVNLGVGYIYYALDGADDSQEFYVSLGLDMLLTPTLTVYREVSHYPGWYLNLGISHSFELPRGMTLDLAGSVGYYHYDDDAFKEVDDNLNPTSDTYSNLHEGLVSVALTIPINDYFSVSPGVSYSFPLTDDADNFITASSFSNDSDFVFGGVTVSFAF
jgi:hypothetical protein